MQNRTSNRNHPRPPHSGRLPTRSVWALILAAAAAPALALAQPAPPANDNCRTGTAVGNGVFPFSTLSANSTPGLNASCSTIGADVWYLYTPPATGIATVSTCGQTSLDTVIAVYNGCGFTAPPTELGCNDDGCGVQSTVSFAATGGVQYAVRVGGFQTDRGSGTVTFSQGGILNDSCSTCSSINGSGLFPFDNTTATTGNEGQTIPGCNQEGSTAITRDVWYCWSAPCTGPVTISTCGLTNLDTKLAVFSALACPPTASALLACNDDACGLQSSVTFQARVEQRYLIQLGSFAGRPGGRGQFRVTCDPAAPVACCLPNGRCVDLTPAACTQQQGVAGPVGSSCADAAARGLALDRGRENIVPRSWQPKNRRWNRDANFNFVEDSIDAMGANARVTVILNLNEIPNKSDLDRFAALGTIGYTGRHIPVVELRNVRAADAVALGADERVAMVQLDGPIQAMNGTSVPASRVTPSAAFSPNTLVDAYPAIDGTGITIGIMDTGVDDGVHESLPGVKFVGGYNTFTDTETNPDDDQGHGTHCAGIALGIGSPVTHANRGMAPGASLADIKVLDSTGSGTTIGIIRGLDKCIERRVAWNLRVLNLSLGGCTASNGSDALSEAVNRCVQAGIFVAVAAGNSPNCGLGNNASLVSSPASADDGMTVASVSDLGTIARTDDVISTFSLTGPRTGDGDADTSDERKPDIAGFGSTDASGTPGTGGILSAQFNTASGYFRKAGTSMAAPQVAGLAALLVQARPTITPLSLKQLIIDTAEDRGAAGWDATFGNGLINAYAAIQKLNSPNPTDMKFDVYVGKAGSPDWWLSPDVTPVNPVITEGVPNSIKARFHNNGANDSGPFKVRVGIYNFSNSQSQFSIATVDVPNVPAGAYASVTAPWTPLVNGPAPGTVHACLKAEIVFPTDTDFSNNQAQHNITIVQAFSPARFSFQVVNPTPEDLTVRLESDFNPCSDRGGWTVTFPEPTFTLAAGSRPRIMQALVDPGLERRGSKLVSIRVVGVRPNGQEIDLGGVGLLAQKAPFADCNGNGVEDAGDIAIGASPDTNRNGVPDECDCRADFDRSGEVDANDISAFLNAWYGDITRGTVVADFDRDGETDANDVSAFINAWYVAIVNGGHC